MNTGSEVNQYGFHLKNIPQAFLRRLADLRTEYRHTLILVLLAGMLMSCDSAADETGNNEGGDKKIQLSLGGEDDVATQPERPVVGGGNDDGVARITLSPKDIKTKEAGDLAVANGARLPEDTPGGYGAENEPIGGTSGGANLADACGENNNQRANLRNAAADLSVALNFEKIKGTTVKRKIDLDGVGIIELSILQTSIEKVIKKKRRTFVFVDIEMFISEENGGGKLAIGDTVVNPTMTNKGTMTFTFLGTRGKHTGLEVRMGGALQGVGSVEEIIAFLDNLRENGIIIH